MQGNITSMLKPAQITFGHTDAKYQRMLHVQHKHAADTGRCTWMSQNTRRCEVPLQMEGYEWRA